MNSLPATNQHLAPKQYVDDATDETSLVSNNQDDDFNNFNLTNTNSITSNFQAVNNSQVITKSYVDQFHHENESFRRHKGIEIYNESGHLVEKYSGQ